MQNKPSLIDETILTVENFAVAKKTSLVELRRLALFAANHMMIDTRKDIDGLVTTLRTYLLKSIHQEMHTEYVDIPATWFEHFKKDHFPAWLKRRFPVKFVNKPFKYEKYVHLCPHADFAWGHESHISFLRHEPLQYRAGEDDMLGELLTDEWWTKINTAVMDISTHYWGRDLREALLEILKLAKAAGIVERRNNRQMLMVTSTIENLDAPIGKLRSALYVGNPGKGLTVGEEIDIRIRSSNSAESRLFGTAVVEKVEQLRFREIHKEHVVHNHSISGGMSIRALRASMVEAHGDDFNEDTILTALFYRRKT